MILSRRTFLGTLGAAALAGPNASLANTGSARNLIILFASGGWDVNYLFDPKPGVLEMDEGGYEHAFGDGVLWFNADRPSVTEFFAAYGDISSVLRGVRVPAISHQGCTTRMLTGGRDPRRADVGAMVAHHLAGASPMPYLDVSGGAQSGPYGADLGYVGHEDQLRRLVVDNLSYGDRDRPRHHPDADQEALIRAFVESRIPSGDRAALGLNARRMDSFGVGLERSHTVESYAAFFEQAEGREFASQAGTAAKSLEQGLARAAYLEVETDFDTHSSNWKQAEEYEVTFDALLSLMTELETRSGASGGTLLDETVVMVCSEMGRTPQLNDGGKGHWPHTSCMLVGGPIRGGTVGRTDNDLKGIAMDASTGLDNAQGIELAAENVLAGILDTVGVDPSLELPNVTPLTAFQR